MAQHGVLGSAKTAHRVDEGDVAALVGDVGSGLIAVHRHPLGRPLGGLGKGLGGALDDVGAIALAVRSTTRGSSDRGGGRGVGSC